MLALERERRTWTKTTFPENWRPGRAAMVTVTGLPNSMWGSSYS